MRIAYLVLKNLLRGGGIEKYTYEVGRRLAGRGHEIVVYSMGNYGKVETTVDGIQVVKVSAPKVIFAEKTWASGAAALRATFSRPQFDIFHFHSVAAGIFGFMPLMLKRRTVLQMHGVEWQRSRWGGIGRRVLSTMEQLSLAMHANCTAVSQTQCEFYRKRYGKDLVYIPTGAELPLVCERTDKLEEIGLEPGRYILFTSRLVAEKGAHYLIEAFKSLSSDYKLVIAGDARGEEQYMRLLRSSAGNDGRVLFPGYVEGDLKNQLLSNAAIYVQPSEVEGLSIALLEAMSYGLCCLVSDIPENIEAIKDAGHIFRNKNALDLGNKLGILLNDAALRQRYGQSARHRVAEFYSWDHVTDRLEELYSSIRIGRQVLGAR